MDLRRRILSATVFSLIVLIGAILPPSSADSSHAAQDALVREGVYERDDDWTLAPSDRTDADFSGPADDALWVPSFVDWVTKLVHSPRHDLLMTTDLIGVSVVDIETEQLVSGRGLLEYSDIDVSPDGNYFFSLGRDDLSFPGDPPVPDLIDRYDIVGADWIRVQAPATAYALQATSSTRVVLVHDDAVTLNSFEAASQTMTVLDSVAAPYRGSLAFDPTTNRIFHRSGPGDTPQIQELQIAGDTISEIRVVSIPDPHGVLDGFGGVTLSADGANLFVGRIQLNATDITQYKASYIAPIQAATDQFAFGSDGDAWFLPTGESIGTLSWTPTATYATPVTNDVWLARNDGQILHCKTVGAAIGCPVPYVCSGFEVTVNMLTNGGKGWGTPGPDVILGTAGADRIYGGAGDDRICARDGADIINGQDGNDLIFGEGGADIIYGAGGNDVVGGGSGWDTIQGNEGDDELYGGEGNDNINAGPGNDEAHGNAGHDLINLGAGQDIGTGWTGNDRINGQSGNDQLDAGDGNNRVWGSFGDDNIVTGSGYDAIWGGWGHDTIDSGGRADLIWGEQGDDHLAGGDGWDRLHGGADTDTCDGGNHRDVAIECENEVGIP